MKQFLISLAFLLTVVAVAHGTEDQSGSSRRLRLASGKKGLKAFPVSEYSRDGFPGAHCSDQLLARYGDMDTLFFFNGYRLASQPAHGYCALYPVGVSKTCYLDESKCEFVCDVEQINHTSAGVFERHTCLKRAGKIRSIVPRSATLAEAANILGLDVRNQSMSADTAHIHGWSGVLEWDSCIATDGNVIKATDQVTTAWTIGGATKVLVGLLSEHPMVWHPCWFN